MTNPIFIINGWKCNLYPNVYDELLKHRECEKEMKQATSSDGRVVNILTCEDHGEMIVLDAVIET